MVKNLDVLKERFARLMAEQAPAYLALCEGYLDDKAVERAIEAFGEKDRRETFYRLVMELETLYEIISPDVFLRDYLERYGRLATLHQVVRNAFDRPGTLDRDVARKTEWLIRERAASYGLATTMPLVRIDEETLAALKQDGESSTGRVFNLGRSLAHAAAAAAAQQPYLVPIGERAAAVLDAFDDRQLTTRQALQELERLFAEFVQAQQERARTGLDLGAFTIYWILKQADVAEPEALASVLDGAFRRFPEHAHRAEDRRQLKAELYKTLLPAVGTERMVELADRLLRLQRT